MTFYFPQAGPDCSEKTCALALDRAQELGIKTIVVASNTGATGRLLLGRVDNLVVVTHHVGFHNPGEDEMDALVRQELLAAGAKLVTATHLFGGVERGVITRFGGLYPGGIIAQTLRTFGQGTKVCLEIAVMALDAGAIPWGQEVIAIGGSGRGADTSLVVKPAHAKDFFASQVLEVICKPRTWEGMQ